MKDTIIILLFILLLGGFFARPDMTHATTVNSDALSSSQPGTPAMHTISFTTAKDIPMGGLILVTFPPLNINDTNDPSQPSASTFQLNGIANADIKIIAGGTDITGDVSISASNPSAVGESPTVSLSLASTTTIAANTPVVIYLGCTTLGTDTCTEQHPLIFNPTKKAATGTADIWKVTVTTKDASNNTLESGIMNVATNDVVTVKATVEPFLSFIIRGLPDQTAMNSEATCGSAHAATVTNAGSATTGTSVNLGALASGTPNYAAQQMSILSNAINGYVITATSSGKLTNAGSGNTIPNAQGEVVGPDAPGPEPLDLKNGGFGIHVCDIQEKVSAVLWGQETEDFANPSPVYPYTMVTSNIPPADNGDTMTLLYGVTVSSKTPGGTYKTSITYTATPLF